MKGMLAAFADEASLTRAVDLLAAAKLSNVETYTAKPLHEESEPSGSPLPLAMFIAGMLGFVGFLLLMAYADVRAYPLDIGGRPRFAWPAFVPIAFELGVLCAMAAGFFGYFLVCRLPRLYEAVDHCEDFKNASRDGWFVSVQAVDESGLDQARLLLASLGALSVEEFGE